MVPLACGVCLFTWYVFDISIVSHHIESLLHPQPLNTLSRTSFYFSFGASLADEPFYLISIYLSPVAPRAFCTTPVRLFQASKLVV